MKVSIIGGGGLVGSCAGFALQAGKIVREITLIDVNQDQCEGQALDLLHGASLMADQKITAAGTPAVADSDVVVITAGFSEAGPEMVTIGCEVPAWYPAHPDPPVLLVTPVMPLG